MIINTPNINAMTTGFKSLYDASFAAAKPAWNQIAMQVPSTTKDMTYGWLGATTSFRKWIGDRVIQNLATHDYKIRNEKFENTVAVPRTEIADDNIGIYNPLMQNLGNDAAMHPDEMVFNLLRDAFTSVCYDGQYFIDTDHPGVDVDGKPTSVSNFGGGSGAPWFLFDTSRPIKPFILQTREEYKFVSLTDYTDENVFKRDEFVYGVSGRGNAGYGLWQLAYGSKQTLDDSAFSAAFAAMTSAKGDNGKPLNVKPTLLVVGPSNRTAALKIAKAETGTSGASNINQGSVEVLVTPWLP